MQLMEPKLVVLREFNTRRNPDREVQHYHAMGSTVFVIILAVIVMSLLLMAGLRSNAISDLMKATLYACRNVVFVPA